MITAFNQAYSNSPSGERTLTGRLSGILSGALNRNQNTNNASDQNSGKYGGLVTALQNVLSKNNSSSAPISADTIRELETLQTQLQPVAGTLKNLNVDIGTTPSSSATGQPALTPTGRSKPESKPQGSQQQQ